MVGSVGMKGNGGMVGMLGNGKIGVKLVKGLGGRMGSWNEGNVGEVGLEGSSSKGEDKIGFNCDGESDMSCFIDASSFRPTKGRDADHDRKVQSSKLGARTMSKGRWVSAEAMVGSVGMKGNGGMVGMHGNGKIGVKLVKGLGGRMVSWNEGNVGEVGLEGSSSKGADKIGFNCDGESDMSCFIDASSFRPTKGRDAEHDRKVQSSKLVARTMSEGRWVSAEAMCA